MTPLLLTALTGYFLGSIPFGFLIAKAKGIDIREHGSKNIGATNVLRVLGKPYGYATFALDVLKGVVSVLLATHYLAPGHEFAGILAAITCILGHNFPIWLGFKGGKGIATSGGVLLGLMPLAVVIVTAIWVLSFLTTRYVSLASILTAAALPITAFALLHFGYLTNWNLFYFSLVVAALAIWRHRSNIQRLLNGTESKFVKKPRS